jgi:hypothetical protein
VDHRGGPTTVTVACAKSIGDLKTLVATHTYRTLTAEAQSQYGASYRAVAAECPSSEMLKVVDQIVTPWLTGAGAPPAG